jgi:large subunit ribosomal protein L13
VKTIVTKPAEVERHWYLIDADGKVLGRLASEIARILLGKDQATFSRSLDMADFVVVINADKIKVTGNKLEDKKYYRHSGYPGGIKERTLADIGMPAALKLAIKGMLPKNKLQDVRLSRVKIYPGMEHPHEAQQPITLDKKKED